MCSECCDSGAVLWSPASLAAPAATTTPGSSGEIDLFNLPSALEQQLDAALAEFEAAQPPSADAPSPPSNDEQHHRAVAPAAAQLEPAIDEQLAEGAQQLLREQQPPPRQQQQQRQQSIPLPQPPRQQQQQSIPLPLALPPSPSAAPPLAAAPPQPPPPFITHEQERLELGKPLWSEISEQILRPTHDGTLRKVRGNQSTAASSDDMKDMLQRFPTLPYVVPPPAEVRARSLLASKSNDGAWSDALKQEARACFEAEAAAIKPIIAIPEVVAREELLADSRFQVKSEGSIVGCKCFCTSCGTNEFVLIDELNVNHKTRVRFAYGNNCTLMPIAFDYICCNPECKSVQAKLKPEELQVLKEHTRSGLLEAVANKKVTELKKMGARFSGLDHDIILSLPPLARSAFGGLTFFERAEEVLALPAPARPPARRSSYTLHNRTPDLRVFGCGYGAAQILCCRPLPLPLPLSCCRFFSLPSSCLLDVVAKVEGEDGKKKSVKVQGGCDLALATKLITSKANLTEIEAELAADAEVRQEQLYHRYISFAKAQMAHAAPARPISSFFQPAAGSSGGGTASGGDTASGGAAKWPSWRLPKMSDSLLHPTTNNLRSTYVALHAQYEPWLLGDMLRRSPGKGASSDGTFRLMMRTRTDGGVLLLIIGDDHTVVAWYVCRSESWKELLPGLLFLRARLERLGTLHLLLFWWSDRCCDGAKDVSKHVLCSIFPGIKRAPYRDCFHGINGVNKTGHEGLPEQKSELGSDLFGALREIPEDELKPPMAWLQQSRGYDASKARATALANFREDGIIRNRSFSSQKQHKQWQAVRAKWAARKALARSRGERSVIRAQSGTQQGTLETMDATAPCILKGCFVDPMLMEDMYVETRVRVKSKLQERLRLGDTNRNESRHGRLNEIVEHVSRMGEDLMGTELDFKLYLTNKKSDVLFGRVDEHSFGCFPWNDAELNALAADYLDGPPLFGRAAAPSNALPPLKPIRPGDKEWEPLGFRYLEYLKNSKDEKVVAEALAAAEAALAEEAAAEAALAAEEEAAEPAAAAEQAAEPAAEVAMEAADGAAEAAEGAAEAAEAMEEGAADDGALVLLTPPRSVASSSSPCVPSTTRRQGGLTFSGGQKSMHVTPALTAEISPTSEAELKLMAEAMTQATREGLGEASMAMYDRAAGVYLERLIVCFSHPTMAPPDGLRYGKTSGPRIKAVAERCTRMAREAERERAHRGANGVAAVPSGAVLAAVVEAASPMAAVVDGETALLAANGAAMDGTMVLVGMDPSTPTAHAVMADAVVADAVGRRAPPTSLTVGGKRKDSRAARNERYKQKAQKACFTVTLAQLQDDTFKMTGPKLKQVAKLVEGVPRKNKAGYGAKEMRAAIVAQMRAQEMSCIYVVGSVERR